MRYFALSALTTAVLAATANAQPSGVIEDFVITARKRNESNVDVPVTVTVFTANKILAAGIEKPSDFIALTPNITLVQTQNAGNSFVTARGISQNRNTEMSVAVLMDGVLMVNPAQFNQELFDIEQIEVLKGPQGALYGRNAIGGAITITTKKPTDTLAGAVQVGADSGPGWRTQANVSGPVGSSETLKFRASASWKDTDGFIDNTYLNEKADPYQDQSARLRLLWEPSSTFSADARFNISQLDSQALYYNIRSPLAEPFPGAPISLGHGKGDPDSVNDTSLDVRVNNAGVNERDLQNVSLKMDWELAGGTFTSITAYDTLEELLTGDAFDFVPTQESIGVAFGFTDQNQSQYLEVSSTSQEFRFVSAPAERLRWVAGVYGVATTRFISTGNMVDTGKGVLPVYRSPRGQFPFDFTTDAINPQATFLADDQDNFAWAVFGELTYDLSDATEVAFSLRYDEDTRENTTKTPTAYLPNVPGFPQGFTGEKREQTWDDWQPKLTWRYKLTDDLSYYATLARGFRSGGFNQTGVGPIAAANKFLGVSDTFDKETVDTAEVGMKGRFMDGRIRSNMSLYTSKAEGTYFFIFLAANSTQNLGNLKEVEYRGLEFDVSATVNSYVDLTAAVGITDSEITDSDTKTDIGNRAPNASDYTFNMGADFHYPLTSNGVELFTRVEFRRIGETAFFDRQQADTNDRDPVNLLDLRVGVELANDWSLTAWGKNALDKEYNAEYSTGGFVFKAPPAVWGVDFVKRF
jgi:iron complex outermembrane recepter protein